MKSVKDFRIKSGAYDSADFGKRATKLPPMKKSGKDRITFDQDDDELYDTGLTKRESILDYYDDEEDR